MMVSDKPLVQYCILVMNKNPIVVEKAQEILEMYQSGLSVWKIGKLINVPGQTVHKLLKRENVECRKQTYTARKYSIDENVFDVIDSHEKAYWLGFLYADGGIVQIAKTSYTFGLTLHRNDRHHLEKFIRFLKTDHVVKDRKDKEASYITIGNANICKNLMEKGMSLRKSLTLLFPLWLSDKYVNSFILGYFDGDGCMHCRKRKYYNELQCALSIISTKMFLSVMQDVIEKMTGITQKKLKKEGKVYVYQIEGKQQLIKMKKWLYKDCNTYLERKYNKFPDICGYAGCIEKVQNDE